MLFSAQMFFLSKTLFQGCSWALDALIFKIFCYNLFLSAIFSLCYSILQNYKLFGFPKANFANL